jgi:phosphate transport system permease protein
VTTLESPPAPSPAPRPAQSLFIPASAGRQIRDRLATIGVTLAFAIAMVPLIWVLGTVVVKGAPLVFHAQWWTNSQKGIYPQVTGGGAYHAIIGSVLQTLVCTVIAAPIGLMLGIYLVEYGRGRLATTTSFAVDVLTGIPSIVAALFVYALFITTLGFQRQGLAVSFALVLLMIPVVVRTTEEMLKLVPNELREASLALGVPKWKTVLRIVIPTAFAGIVTGIMLGIARVIGETAPLLILVGYTKAINTNLTSGFQASLPGMIVDEAKNIALPNPADRAWAAALTLIVLVLTLNLVARGIARLGSVKK